jgi:hypothetical protein
LGTWPDTAFATSPLAHLGHDPARAHWEAAKHALSYLQGTRGWRLTLGGGLPQIADFMDADWDSDRGDRWPVGVYIVKIGSGAVINRSALLYHRRRPNTWPSVRQQKNRYG